MTVTSRRSAGQYDASGGYTTVMGEQRERASDGRMAGTRMLDLIIPNYPVLASHDSHESHHSHG